MLIGAPTSTHADRLYRPGVWIGVALVVVGLYLVFGHYPMTGPATFLLGPLPSGAMFIIFTWRAKDGHIASLRYRLIPAALPVVSLTLFNALVLLAGVLPTTGI